MAKEEFAAEVGLDRRVEILRKKKHVEEIIRRDRRLLALKNKQKLLLTQDQGPDTDLNSERKRLMVEEAQNHYKPRPMPNPAKFHQFYPDEIERKVDDQDIKIKRDFYNRRGQKVRTEYIGYNQMERAEKSSKVKISVEAGSPANNAKKDAQEQVQGLKSSNRPGSARSGVTQQTYKTLTQFSGPTNFTNDTRDVRNKSQGTLFKLTRDTNLVNLLAEDTTLSRDQNIKSKEGSISALNMMKI